MARLNKHHAFRSLAVALLAPLALGQISLGADTPPPVSATTIKQFDLSALRQDLLVQIAIHGVSMPRFFVIDGVLTDEQAKEWHEPGYVRDDKAIIGPRIDGQIREFFRSGAFAQDCSMYLDEHFDRTRLFSIVHETSHHVDSSLDLSAAILDDAFSKTELIALAPELFGNRKESGGFAFSLVRERVADTAAAIYMLSNYHDESIVKAHIDLRWVDLDIKHYSSNYMSKALAAFAKEPRQNIDIVTATKMAAKLVHDNIDSVANEFNGLFESYKDPAIDRENGIVRFDVPSKNPYIIQAKAARDRLCQAQQVAQAKPQ